MRSKISLHPDQKPFALSGDRLRLLAAFDATPEDHQAGVLQQRNPGPKALGSTFLAPVTWDELAAAPWENYWHPEVAPGCQAFKAPIPGLLGVMPVEMLPKGASLRLVDGHRTGFVEAVYDPPAGVRVPVDFTVAIVGVHEGVEMVFTVFPGDPIRPSQVALEEDDEGRSFVRLGELRVPYGPGLAVTVTTEEAVRYGFLNAKISG